MWWFLRGKTWGLGFPCPRLCLYFQKSKHGLTFFSLRQWMAVFTEQPGPVCSLNVVTWTAVKLDMQKSRVAMTCLQNVSSALLSTVSKSDEHSCFIPQVGNWRRKWQWWCLIKCACTEILYMVMKCVFLNTSPNIYIERVMFNCRWFLFRSSTKCLWNRKIKIWANSTLQYLNAVEWQLLETMPISYSLFRFLDCGCV